MTIKTYQLAVRWKETGGTFQNGLHFNKVSAGDPSNAQWLVIANAWKEIMRVRQYNQATWVDYVATQVNGDGVVYDPATCKQVGGSIQSGALTGTLVGASATDGLPPLATMSVNIKTALRGRNRRTHVQLSGFVETDQTQGVWETGTKTAVQASIDAFLAVYGNGGTDVNFRWVVFSKGTASGCFPNPLDPKHRLVHRQAGSPDTATAEVVSATVRPSVTTTRSRIVT